MKIRTVKLKNLFALLLPIGTCIISIMFIFTACNSGDDFRNAVNGEPEAGEFYTLQEAFDNGWLSRGDLRNIAYYYSKKHSTGKKYHNFKPTEISPEVLPAEIENRIKQEYLTEIKQDILSAEISGIHIDAYYGIYGSCVIVEISSDYICADLMIIEEYEIGGVIFYEYGYPIRVYAK